MKDLGRRLPKGVRIVGMRPATVYSTDGSTVTASAAFVNTDPRIAARVLGVQVDPEQPAAVERARKMLLNKRSGLTLGEKTILEVLDGKCGTCPSLTVVTKGESRTKPRVNVACSREGATVFQRTALGREPECPPFVQE